MTKAQWKSIWTLADALGVKRGAFRQWVLRKTVPHVWRQTLVELSGNEFTHKMFRAMDKRNDRDVL
jgi:hypothetical protein